MTRKLGWYLQLLRTSSFLLHRGGTISYHPSHEDIDYCEYHSDGMLESRYVLKIWREAAMSAQLDTENRL